MKQLLLILSIIGTTFLIFGCEGMPEQPEFNNPYFQDDIDTDDFDVWLLEGPRDNETVYSSSVTFKYEGTQSVNEYSFNLDNTGWSDWTSYNSVTFDFLAEGPHTFELKVRDFDYNESPNTLYSNFTVDAISGPAIYLSPQQQELYSGDYFTVTVMAEEVSDLMGITIPIQFDSYEVILNSYTIFDYSDSFLCSNGGDVIAIVDTLPSWDTLTFNLAVVDGSPEGVTGSGALLELHFQVSGYNYSTIEPTTDSQFSDSEMNISYFSSDKLIPAEVEVLQ